MELGEVLRRRRMVRNYDPERLVPAATVDVLLAAARRAPSAGFTQGVSLLVLEEPADRASFWSATTSAPPGTNRENNWLRGMRSAPLLILVWTSRDAYLDRYAEPDKGWVDREESRWSAPYWYVDAGMATMAVLLAAVDAELGACFFGVPPERTQAVRDTFGVPDQQLSVGVISVGYPVVDGSPGSPGHRPRLDPDDLIHRSRWTTR